MSYPFIVYWPQTNDPFSCHHFFFSFMPLHRHQFWWFYWQTWHKVAHMNANLIYTCCQIYKHHNSSLADYFSASTAQRDIYGGRNPRHKRTKKKHTQWWIAINSYIVVVCWKPFNVSHIKCRPTNFRTITWWWWSLNNDDEGNYNKTNVE